MNLEKLPLYYIYFFKKCWGQCQLWLKEVVTWHLWIMTTWIPHMQYLFTNTSVNIPVHLFIADLFNMFWLSGRSKNKHFLLHLQRPNLLFETKMQITVIAIFSLWIFVSSFHPLQKLFITQIKWSKGILFAHELWLDVQM